MPDLSHEASSQYWFDYVDPMIYRVITFMESVEDWTLDYDPLLEDALRRLGDELDDIEKVDMSMLNQEEAFIRLVGNIKSGRGLRLLQAIDTVHPGSASRILVHAEETSMGNNDAASFFLKRNITFERLRLLARVFSEYRLQLVARALEGEE
ncbi:type IVB secretion system protein IcmW [Legionella sp. CNM-4043-24]|uniref:type IVB secretion system protein IcmW n=1 Tax=Legionella sp. CNM-4043-24 TaxID=3421646 RepID=UPI00403B12CD